MVLPTLSNTARAMLEAAAQHSQQLTCPPERLPIAARRTVVQSMLKSGLLEEITAADGQPIWRTSEAGEQLALRATPAGLAAVAEPASMEMPEGSNELGPTNENQVPISGATVEHQPPTDGPPPNLRKAATALLAAWDVTANGPPWLAQHFDALRASIAKSSRAASPRAPRGDTKRSLVLTLLGRPEGATVTQVAEATGWARHTVHGFFAGLKKRGISIEVLNRIRQVGPGKQDAAGSYTVYRIREAG